MKKKQTIIDIQQLHRKILHTLSADELHSVLCRITFEVEKLAGNNFIDDAYELSNALAFAIDKVVKSNIGEHNATTSIQ